MAERLSLLITAFDPLTAFTSYLDYLIFDYGSDLVLSYRTLGENRFDGLPLSREFSKAILGLDSCVLHLILGLHHHDMWCC